MLPAACWTVTGDAERSSHYKGYAAPKTAANVLFINAAPGGEKERSRSENRAGATTWKTCVMEQNQQQSHLFVNRGVWLCHGNHETQADACTSRAR